MRDFLLFVMLSGQEGLSSLSLVNNSVQVWLLLSFRLTRRLKTTFLFICRYVALSLFVFYYLSSSTDVALDISVVILFTVSYISLLSLSS